MKKALLLSFAAAFAVNSFAQVETSGPIYDGTVLSPAHIPFSNAQMKGTAVGDTLYFASQALLGPGINYNYNYAPPTDSGVVYGTNALNWKGFARLFSFSQSATADTGFNIIGMVAKFGGRIASSNTNNLTFSVWPQSTAKVNMKTKYYLYGMPAGAPSASSAAIPAKNMSLTNRTAIYLTTPINNTKDDMYVGYTIGYTWGNIGNDTFGLQRIQDETKAGLNYYKIEAGTGDTLLQPTVIIQNSGNTWQSLRYQIGITNGGDPIIYPIIRLNCPNCFPSKIEGFGNNGLNITGMFPNPAVNQTNVKFDLQNAADVSIFVFDATGRMVKSIEKNDLNAGNHTVNIETSELAAGNYVMALETSTGGAIALQFTIAK